MWIGMLDKSDRHARQISGRVQSGFIKSFIFKLVHVSQDFLALFQ
jgi:hypothetical protein